MNFSKCLVMYTPYVPFPAVTRGQLVCNQWFLNSFVVIHLSYLEGRLYKYIYV